MCFTTYACYRRGTGCRVILGSRTQVQYFHYLLLVVVQRNIRDGWLVSIPVCSACYVCYMFTFVYVCLLFVRYVLNDQGDRQATYCQPLNYCICTYVLLCVGM